MAKEEDKVTTALSIVEPIAPTEKLVEAMKRFEDLKRQLLAEDDWQVIWVKVRDPDTGEERRERKKFIRRTGFRKLALAFGLSNRLMDEQRVDRPDFSFMWKIRVEVKAPNGRTSVGVAVCDSRERGWAHPEHDVYSTSFTRALNRAISDTIVGGVVSAEEIEAPEQLPEKTGEGVPQAPKPTLGKILDTTSPEPAEDLRKGQPIKQETINGIIGLSREAEKLTGEDWQKRILDHYGVPVFFNLSEPEGQEAMGKLKRIMEGRAEGL